MTEKPKKETLRMAEIKGNSIKWKYRKSERYYCEATGETDEIAIAIVLARLEHSKERFRTLELDTVIRCYDVEATTIMGGTVITRPMMPEWTPRLNGYKEYPLPK